MLNKFWKNKIKFNWIFGLVLILSFAIPRYMIVLSANITGKYNYIFILFFIMWFLPLIFLSKEGRKTIGIRKVKNVKWIFYSLLIGAGFSVFVYLAGLLIYEHSYSNWFAYMAKPFEMYSNEDESVKLILYGISTTIAMTFSPIGEELLFRGIVHESFKVNFGDNKASYGDSLAFAITHLAHFGIVYINEKWDLLLIPALLWLTLMFLVSRLFFICRKKSDSILGAIVCHSSFNIVMMYITFYLII